MNKIDFKKNIMPHLLSVFIFLIASGIYFLPELKGGKIQSHDKMSYVGASKEKVDFDKKGETILWTSRMFSGMPLFQVSYERNSNLLKHLETIRNVVPYSMGKSFGLMLCFYIALVLLGIRGINSIFLSIAFGFSTWFLLSIEAAHSSKVYAISYVTPFIASIVAAYRGKLLIGALFTTIFLSLMISSNHPQIAFYSLFFVITVFLIYAYKFISEGNLVLFLKKSLVLFCFGVLALFTNASLIWTSYDYSKESTRGGKSELTKSDQGESEGLSFDYAMRWSYGKMESFNMLIPGLYASGYNVGEKSETVESLVIKGIPLKQAIDYGKGIPMYYGSQPFTSGPTYLGAVVLFLFFLSFFSYKGKLKWALLSAFILSLFFAWGLNFEVWNRLFFNNFPMFNKFRAPSMWLILAIISTFMGAALALKSLIDKKYDKNILVKGIYISGGILASVCILFFLFGTSLIDSFSGSYDEQLQQSGFPIDAIIADRIALMKSDALRSLFFILAAASISWLWVNEKIKKENILIAAFGFLILSDFVPVGQRYLNKNDFIPIFGKELTIPMTAADASILQDKSLNYRVFNSTVSSFNDNSTSYYHQSTGGYSAVKLFRYQDLIDYHLSKGNMKVFNMLNTKYFIQGKPGDEKAQLNSGALGSVWFAKYVIWAESADDEMENLNSFNPASDVVIDKRYNFYLNESNFSGEGNVELVDFHPEKMIYSSNSTSSQFAVFSEIWYKGNQDWKAYIDGKETEFIRVNYLLRGLFIPEGNHQIIFEFKPNSHYKGNLISYITSILVILLMIFLMIVRKNTPPQIHCGLLF